jgi:DNA-binding CsgD family transcriptional regulator
LKAGEQMRAAFIVGPAYAASVEWDLWAGNPQLAAEAASRAISRASSAGADQPYWLIRLLPLGLAAEAERAVQARAQRDEATVVAARSRAGEYADQLEQLATQPLARLPAVRPLAMWGAAEQSRLEGRSDPEAWAGVREGWAAVSRPFFEAYAAFRQAEALLAAHHPRIEAQAALRHAHAIASRLGARPLLGWIEGLARRARLALRAPEAATATARTSVTPADPAAVALDRYGLTRREREILALLAGGWTNRRIAEALFIGESTAGVHVANIIGKLGAANRVEAAAVAARLGLSAPAGGEVEE